jgi:PAS domain S-box-containing protein
LRGRDGTYRWLRTVAQPVLDQSGRLTGWSGAGIDIEDQKRAEEALRSSERRLRAILESFPAQVVVLTAQGRLEYVNPRVLQYIGIAFDEFASAGGTEHIHPDDVELVRAIWSRSTQDGTAYQATYRIRRFDGLYRWHETRVEPRRDAHGTIVAWYGLLVDVDERKQAEDALREREGQLRLQIERIPAMTIAMSAEGRVSYLSQRLARFLGIRASEVASFDLGASVHADDHPEFEHGLRHALHAGEPFVHEHRRLRADGVPRWMSMHLEPTRDASGRVVQWYGVMLDVDDMKKLDEALESARTRLARATQVATLAELSAAVAHEINQPLTAIVAHGHACLRWLSAEPPNLQRARLTMDRIVRDGYSAVDVVTHTRALFSKAAPSTAPLNFNELIAEVHRLMREEISLHGATLKVASIVGLPAVFADRVQIQQVLVNLIRNALEAMLDTPPAGRILSIRVARTGANDVQIEVADRGSGFASHDRPFEPFYTTKRSGMGVGLAICRSIIEANEGRIWATRNPDRGATVCFTLPLTMSAP